MLYKWVATLVGWIWLHQELVTPLASTKLLETTLWHEPFSNFQWVKNPTLSLVQLLNMPTQTSSGGWVESMEWDWKKQRLVVPYDSNTHSVPIAMKLTIVCLNDHFCSSCWNYSINMDSSNCSFVEELHFLWMRKVLLVRKVVRNTL